ncbi:MAG: ATP synthase F1 subunit epsilon [Clostridia bacterium]
MISNKFELVVMMAERLVVQASVDSLVLFTVEGQLAVFANHAPLMATLEPGVLQYRRDGITRKLAVSGGFLEVLNNQAKVFAFTAEKPEEIDLTRAMQAKQKAEGILEHSAAEKDMIKAQTALKRALARISAAKR